MVAESPCISPAKWCLDFDIYAYFEEMLDAGTDEEVGLLSTLIIFEEEDESIAFLFPLIVGSRMISWLAMKQIRPFCVPALHRIVGRDVPQRLLQ